jgi:hypothetical protein
MDRNSTYQASKAKERDGLRQAGWRAIELWLSPEGQAILERIRQPGESLRDAMHRALELASGAIEARTRQLTSESSRLLTSQHNRREASQSTMATTTPPMTRSQPPERPSVIPASQEGTGDKAAALRLIIPRITALRQQHVSYGDIAKRFAEEFPPDSFPAAAVLRGHPKRWHKGTIDSWEKKYGATDVGNAHLLDIS